jgi:selenide, water dikinase
LRSPGSRRTATANILKQIFAGGLAALQEAGVALLGGHTVQDAEIKFGYAITGEVDPARILSNAGARPGDALLLTKAIGTGVITTALKFDRAPAAAVSAAIASMIALNRAAAEVAGQLPAGAVHACTDITGFGLAGHATEMATASGCTLEIQASAVPLLEGARALVQGNIPGGGRTNRQHFEQFTRIDAGVDPRVADLLFDPQTSGGLLLAIDASARSEAEAGLTAAGVPVAFIGRASARGDAPVRILP